MADVVASAARGKLVEYVTDQIVNEFKYLFCYTTNIQNLNEKVQQLKAKREREQQRKDESERNAEVIYEAFNAYLEDVDNKIREAEDVLNLDTPTNFVLRCLCLECPNLKFRHSQGREATKITASIVELQTKEFENVGYRQPTSQMRIPLPRDVEGLETRQSTKKEIIRALEDEDTFIVGICGMPGVGKTTMAKEIANDVKKNFNEVAFVVVSKDPAISIVQNHIAEALGQKINEANEVVRAERLHQRLTYDVEKKILVILHDVWEEIDLGSIGFPQKGARKGLKILLTSRFENVCRTMKADRVEEVKVLPKNEALKLLKDVAEISNDTSEDVKHLATLVAKECSWLPLSLDVIGKRLINKKEHVWRDILLKLKNCRVWEEKVYRSIQVSYDELEDDGSKSLLLLCSLFPEDYEISIETLFQYAKGLEIFKDTIMLFQARDRVSSKVDDLKSCNLLLPGYDQYTVKLHDVVRDFCLLIASRGKDVYMVKHNDVKEWPKHDKDDQLTAISLTFDDKSNEPPSGLEYPNLKLLRLVCRRSREMNIPDDFFLKMNQLRVVHFYGPSFNDISSSIQSLTNLRTLHFDWCKLNSNLSNIGSLKKLEILSFIGSDIAEFPIEIAQLSNLKSLDLRSDKYPRRRFQLPRDVLSSLNKLEELYLGDSFATFGADHKSKVFDQVEKEYIIGELSSLKGLHTFQIVENDPEFLPQMLKKMRPKELNRFQIILSRSHDSHIVSGHFSKSLHLEDLEATAIKHTTIRDSLLRRTENLSLFNVSGSLKNLVSELDEDGFVNLKTLNLERCSFEYLIELPFNGTSAFSILEQLYLQDLSNLKGIWNGNCDMLEHVVARDAAKSEVTDLVLEVTKLKRLYLRGLRNLKSFRYLPNVDFNALFNKVKFPNLWYLDVTELDNIEKILGDDIQPKALEKLKHVQVSSCHGLTTIAQSDSVKALQNLESLLVRDCSHLDVLFELEGLKVTKDETQSFLSRLRSLELHRLHKLVHIARRIPEGICVFQNLTSLYIRDCGSLRYLFTPAMATSLSGLEILSLGNCEAIKEIIGREEEIEMPEPAFIDKEREELNKLVFPKLSTLKLIELQSLRMFCSENIKLVFPSLHKLVIANCSVMIKFSPEEPTAPKLKKIEKGEHGSVDFSNVLDPGLFHVEDKSKIENLYRRG